MKLLFRDIREKLNKSIKHLIFMADARFPEYVNTRNRQVLMLDAAKEIQTGVLVEIHSLIPQLVVEVAERVFEDIFGGLEDGSREDN